MTGLMKFMNTDDGKAFHPTAAEQAAIAKLAAAVLAAWCKDGTPHGLSAKFDSVLKIAIEEEK